MTDLPRPNSEEVEQLLLNAQLRDELEPFLDESVDLVDVRRMPTSRENEFLECMLAWERAPVLPICSWFEPELVLPHPDSLDNAQLHQTLWETIKALHTKRIVLEFTDHLSDRELYCLLFRDILPSHEKKIDKARNYLHWHCVDETDEPTWLRYYASEEERQAWTARTGEALPPAERPPYPRRMPRRPQ